MLFRPEKESLKKQSAKSRKFAKGLVHGFSRKIDLSVICVFWGNLATKKWLFVILDRKECFLDRNCKV